MSWWFVFLPWKYFVSCVFYYLQTFQCWVGRKKVRKNRNTFKILLLWCYYIEGCHFFFFFWKGDPKFLHPQSPKTARPSFEDKKIVSSLFEDKNFLTISPHIDRPVRVLWPLPSPASTFIQQNQEAPHRGKFCQDLLSLAPKIRLNRPNIAYFPSSFTINFWPPSYCYEVYNFPIFDVKKYEYLGKMGRKWQPPIGTALKGVLHPWALFLKNLCIFSKNKAEQLWAKYPIDLVRNVPRNSKITVSLQ